MEQIPQGHPGYDKLLKACALTFITAGKIPVFILTGDTGLAHNFELHTGAILPMDGIPDIGASGNIVLGLVSIIPRNRSQKLFFLRAGLTV